MNSETTFLYGYVTGDIARLERFVARWREAGVTAIRRLAIQALEYSIDGDDSTATLQRRLVHEALARVSWLSLGYQIVRYDDERRAA